MQWPAARLNTQGKKSFGMYERAAASQRPRNEIYHLEVGRPHSDTPAHIKAAAKAALDAGIVHYGDLRGLASLREALAERYVREAGASYSAEQILITNGVTQASYAAFMAALDPGDEVIVLEPFYPQHHSKIELAGARVVPVPLSRQPDGSYRLDANAVAAAVTARTRMIVLINPANPTGTVYRRAELEQLATIATQHDLLVLSDEVYEFITFDGHEHITFASLPGMHERTITVSAFTKAYAMDGWRVGYAAAPEHMIDDMRRITMSTTTHPCVFAQEGALAAVTGPQDCLRQMVEEDRRARDLVVGVLASIRGVQCPIPQGTIYAFPDMSGLGLDADDLVVRIFEATGVAIESGAFYGRNCRRNLRVCFGSEPYARTAEAMQRVKLFLQSGAFQ
jgi:aspartate aminotransferase